MADASSENVLRFGKYKGKSIDELKNEDGRYLIWLSCQDWVNPELKHQIEEVMDDVVINFGRYKGTTMKTLKRENPKYHKWIFEVSSKPKED